MFGGTFMAKSSSSRMQWARLGAEARLQVIEQERAEILAAFPDLRSGARPAKAAVSGKRRRTMSAAARRRMSAGMRRYWAKRRALQKKTEKGAA
jgi:hypothetical protein